jgi:hypothetical protein
MTTTRFYGVVATVALVFGAAACGGGDDSSGGGDGADADSPLVQALAANLLEDGEDSPVANQEEPSAGPVVSSGASARTVSPSSA